MGLKGGGKSSRIRGMERVGLAPGCGSLGSPWTPGRHPATANRNPGLPAGSASLGAAAEPLHGVLEQLAVRGQAEFVLDGLAVGLDRLD